MSVPDLELIDYFAAKAMQSLLVIGAERVRLKARDEDGSESEVSPDHPWYFDNWDYGVTGDGENRGVAALAQHAYEVADAMMHERAERIVRRANGEGA